MVRERFINYLQYEKRYSSLTIQAYHNDLEQFEKFLLQRYELNQPEKADQKMIRSWLAELFDTKNLPRSINRKLTTLKTFFRFCQKNGYVAVNPAHNLNASKTSKRLPTFVLEDKMKPLFSEIDFGQGFEAERNRLILKLFYLTGIRKSELCGIQHSDIDFGQKNIRIIGKNNKERFIPIEKDLEDDIKHYEQLKSAFFSESEIGNQENNFNAQLPNKQPPFFVTSKGKPLNPRSVYTIVHTFLSHITTIEKRSPHVLRHTFATHMLNNGADINIIKEILGHANLAATQIYTHNTIDKLKKIYKTAHPRA